MRTEDFSELVASIKQAGEIRRGQLKPSRVTTIGIPDVQKIRDGLGLSQSEFALMIGVSARDDSKLGTETKRTGRCG